MKPSLKSAAIAAGAVFATGMTGVASADANENPFGMSELSSGYMVAGSEEGKDGEGKCGEGKCGEGKTEGGDGHGGEGQGGDKKGEGKCGEGKCGG